MSTIKNLAFKILLFVESDECKKHLASTPYSNLIESFLDVLGAIYANSPEQFNNQI